MTRSAELLPRTVSTLWPDCFASAVYEVNTGFGPIFILLCASVIHSSFKYL